MVITFEEYNRVVDGLRQQLMLHRTREIELKNYLKNRDEANEKAWDINNKAALRIDELVKELDALRKTHSDSLTENLNLAANNLSLLNDFGKAREEIREERIRVASLEKVVKRLKLKNNKGKDLWHK